MGRRRWLEYRPSARPGQLAGGLCNSFHSLANGNRTQLSATIDSVADFLNTYSYDALNELTQLVQQGQTGGNAVATKGANLTYNALGQLATGAMAVDL